MKNVNTSFSRFFKNLGPVLFLAVLLIHPFVGLSAANEDKRTVLEKVRNLSGTKDDRVRPVKNVILMIPDGCSLATVSAARWYQWLLNPDLPALNIDPYVCGTVRTSSSNAPIGDSAPTTSCYMTGELSRTGYISTYPLADGSNDIFTVDRYKAYQPLMTVLEAAKVVQGKSTGLVFSCEFPHATPADCSAHDYYRGRYENIAPQMVYNRIDFVAGGGTSYLKPELQEWLRKNGYEVQLDDAAALRSFKGKRLWSLFNKRDLTNDLDRNPALEPSLAELTGKAISTLSANSKGFFLMVEGSKVDWAAHANEPMGMITEFLAFDRACKVALDYARRDGNTAVVILPDHGNSGISIGSSRLPGYDKLTKDQLFSGVLQFKRTPGGLADILKASPWNGVPDSVLKYSGITLSTEQIEELSKASDCLNSPVPASDRKSGPTMSALLQQAYAVRSPFGFTTKGHTGEEVFLASYHPKGDELKGVRFNFEVNDYLCKLLNLEGKLPELTSKYFARHQEVFEGCTCTLEAAADTTYTTLTVRKGPRKLVVYQNSSEVKLDGQWKSLPTVAVYVDKNQTFYLPAFLADWLK